MKLTFDPTKRAATLADRGLDFAAAGQIFAGLVFEFPDERFDYEEERIITVGLLDGRMIVVVWTQRGQDRHIISMRKANGREQERYKSRLG